MHTCNLLIKLKPGVQIAGSTVLKELTNRGSVAIEVLLKADQFGFDDYSKREKKFGFDRWHLIKCRNREEVIQVYKTLETSDDVEYIEEDEVNFIYREPNDSFWKQQWALRKMLFVPAWNYSSGKDVVVAVIDTGVDLQHRDLIGNLWMDANGKHGYDFVNGDCYPHDDNGHGTHVAGIIAAVMNNHLGIAGAAPMSNLMVLKGFDQNGVGYISVIVNCILFAIRHGAKVINNSWGPGRSKILKHLAAYAVEENCVMTFAAGNNDARISQDAILNGPVISVAATDKDDCRLSTSNYGDCITCAAPGYQILSTFLHGGYRESSGTSAACAHVSGLIALMVSAVPQLGFYEVRTLLQSKCEPCITEKGKPIGSGRVNAQTTIAALTKVPTEEHSGVF